MIQARKGSTRLHNKICLPLGDSVALVKMVERVKRAKTIDETIVATTTLLQDQEIVALCRSNGISVFQGHPSDLLDRHYEVMKHFNGDVIVKIPSDCPLIDPKVIDEVVGYYLRNESRFDYVSNLHPQSYPDGNDVEAFSKETLIRAWIEAKAVEEREHTTPYIWNNPRKFRIGNVGIAKDYSLTHRWTLDYYEDYLLIKEVFHALSPVNPFFEWKDIVDFLDRNPQIKRLNKNFLGYVWYAKSSYPIQTQDKDFRGVG